MEHGEAIAPGVPTVLVANHTNGLVDALLFTVAVGLAYDNKARFRSRALVRVDTPQAAFVAAPLCGYVTVLFSERVQRVGGALTGARAVRSRSMVIETVLANRRAVEELAQGVADTSSR
jgi:hypothetical protein